MEDTFINNVLNIFDEQNKLICKKKMNINYI